MNNQTIKPEVESQLQNIASSKSQLAAFIFLCFGLIGLNGLHRFYVGKVVSGFLHLLTLGVFGIGWIFDCVLILTGAFEDKKWKRLLGEGKYILYCLLTLFLFILVISFALFLYFRPAN